MFVLFTQQHTPLKKQSPPKLLIPLKHKNMKSSLVTELKSTSCQLLDNETNYLFLTETALPIIINQAEKSISLASLKDASERFP
jgi:hypothetical protein